MRFAAALPFAALVTALGAQVAAAGPDPTAGRKLAIERCARCHVIGDHNPYGGINSTPSFWIFARKPQIYVERLRTFDQRRPHLSRDMDVSADDIRHIMAYVETLERP